MLTEALHTCARPLGRYASGTAALAVALALQLLPAHAAEPMPTTVEARYQGGAFVVLGPFAFAGQPGGEGA